MDLHYSQTLNSFQLLNIRLNPLWIYTTLKLSLPPIQSTRGLNPLWIYTTLKLTNIKLLNNSRLNPLWIYTTLKPQIRENVLHTSHIIHKRYRFCRIIIFHTNLHQLSIAFHFLKLDIPYFPEK